MLGDRLFNRKPMIPGRAGELLRKRKYYYRHSAEILRNQKAYAKKNRKRIKKYQHDYYLLRKEGL